MLIVYHPTYQGEIRDQHSKAGKLHLPPGTDVPERTAQREALAAEHSKRREGVDKLNPFDASLQCNPGIPSTSAVWQGFGGCGKQARARLICSFCQFISGTPSCLSLVVC